MIYYTLPPGGNQSPNGVPASFWQDKYKMNLLWLVEPRLDTEGLQCLVGNPMVDDIHQHIDRTTIRNLEKPPLAFMRYWRSVDDGNLMLTDHFPEGYKALMQARAEGWGKACTHGNVVYINFGRKAA